MRHKQDTKKNDFSSLFSTEIKKLLYKNASFGTILFGVINPEGARPRLQERLRATHIAELGRNVRRKATVIFVVSSALGTLATVGLLESGRPRAGYDRHQEKLQAGRRTHRDKYAFEAAAARAAQEAPLASVDDAETDQEVTSDND